MSGWRKVHLYKVAEIERNSIDPSAISDGTTYIGLENIETGGKFANVRSVSTGELASNKFVFTDKHVLYGKLRPYLAKVARPSFEGICSTDILPILPGEELDRDYLTHFLLQPSMIEMATSRSTGANLPRLSPKALAEFLIPLPPIAEQRRIAAILDKAEELRELRRQALRELDAIAQSIFIEMFGDPVSNPKGWNVCSAGSFIIDVTNGLTRRRKESDQGTDIVLRLRDIRAGWIDFSEVNRISLERQESGRYEVTQGDLLFIRVNGNPNYVGRCAIFSGLDEPVYFNDHIMRVKTDPLKVDGKFLVFTLNGTLGKREIAAHRKTSAGQHTINQTGLSKIQLPLPPLHLQQEFTSRIESIDQLKTTHRESLTQLEALFASLQHRAFRGEL